MSSSVFERICRLHVLLSLAVGILIYTQKIKDVITIFGVAKESSHSLRNTGFLLILASFISACVISAPLRRVPERLGTAMVRSDEDKALSFVAGLAAITNIFLLVHYSVEAFMYGDVSKIAVIGAWIATGFAAAGIKVSVVTAVSKKRA